MLSNDLVLDGAALPCTWASTKNKVTTDSSRYKSPSLDCTNNCYFAVWKENEIQHDNEASKESRRFNLEEDVGNPTEKRA